MSFNINKNVSKLIIKLLIKKLHVSNFCTNHLPSRECVHSLCHVSVYGTFIPFLISFEEGGGGVMVPTKL